MTGALRFEPDPREALSVSWRPAGAPGALADFGCRRFEYSSRGDRVPGHLLLPHSDGGPFPLILLGHGDVGPDGASPLESAAPWLGAGAAVAAIDLPLHGERFSAKFSERLAQGDPTDPTTQILWIEFARQAVIDLRRALDALVAVDELDAGRVAYAGFGLGGELGALFCAADERPRAAALALAGGGRVPPEVDPCEYVGRIAPRPVLFVNVERDERIPRAAAERLHGAAGAPHRVEWFEGRHGELPDDALEAIGSFLRQSLEV